MNKKIKKWEPDNFELELNSVWSFKERDRGFTQSTGVEAMWISALNMIGKSDSYLTNVLCFTAFDYGGNV